MSGWPVFFLGIIAAATLAMAVAQVGLLVAAGLLARRMARLADRVEHDLKPLFAHLNAIGRDASRAASLATAQVEHVDRLLTDLLQRVEQLLHLFQTILMGGASEAGAVMSALRAFMTVFRTSRDRRRSRSDDEDALFI